MTPDIVIPHSVKGWVSLMDLVHIAETAQGEEYKDTFLQPIENEGDLYDLPWDPNYKTSGLVCNGCGLSKEEADPRYCYTSDCPPMERNYHIWVEAD